MKPLRICPSTLADNFAAYSPAARKTLFDGKAVSPFLPYGSPEADSGNTPDAIASVGRISLSGAQPKFGMIVSDDLLLRYAQADEQTTHILKPRPSGYHIINKDHCAANEHLTMQIASQVYGIETAANGLCFFQNDEAAYLTRRFDVSPKGKLQQEDFAALMGYTKADGGQDYKYVNASYEECAAIIRQYVKAAPVDLLRFFKLIVFNFITLNDDAHLKNFSLLNLGDEYRLSPAYDLINTSLHLSTPRIFALDKGLFKEGMALSDTRQIGRSDFEEFGKRIGIPFRVIKRELDNFTTDHPLVKTLINKSFLSDALKREYWLSIEYRRKMLTF